MTGTYEATRLPWTRVVELATHLEASVTAQGQVDPDLAVRLARAVLDFQDQLLGDAAKTPRSR